MRSFVSLVKGLLVYPQSMMYQQKLLVTRKKKKNYCIILRSCQWQCGELIRNVARLEIEKMVEEAFKEFAMDHIEHLIQLFIP